jgi:hypothetical protein
VRWAPAGLSTGDPGLEATLLDRGPILGGCGNDPMLIVLRTLRLGFKLPGAQGTLGMLEVGVWWILLGIVGDRVGSADETALEPGRGNEVVEAAGDEGEESEDLRVLAIGREGSGVVGGPKDGRGSVVVAMLATKGKRRDDGVGLRVQAAVGAILVRLA